MNYRYIREILNVIDTTISFMEKHRLSSKERAELKKKLKRYVKMLYNEIK